MTFILPLFWHNLFGRSQLVNYIIITNTNTAKFNPIDIEDHKGEHKNFYGTFYNKLLGLSHLQNLCLEKAPQEFGVHHCHLLDLNNH